MRDLKLTSEGSSGLVHWSCSFKLVSPQTFLTSFRSLSVVTVPRPRLLLFTCSILPFAQAPFVFKPGFHIKTSVCFESI